MTEHNAVKYGEYFCDGSDEELWCVDGRFHLRARVEDGLMALIGELHDPDSGLSDEEASRQLEELKNKWLDGDEAATQRVRAARHWQVWPEHRSKGACDGSCRPGSQTLELTERVAKMRAEKLYDGELIMKGERVVGCTGPILPSTVELDAGAQALIEAGTLVGRKFDSGYCKRSDEWQYWCLPAGQAGLGDRHLMIKTRFDWWSGARDGIFQSHRLTVEPCDGRCQPSPVELTEQAAKALQCALDDVVNQTVVGGTV